ncbi:MAG TPA: hypothetical protein VE978_02345 [Chitinophagales bacterium]|nr:hypothetical protein [Chitinophagales bacterium]
MSSAHHSKFILWLTLPTALLIILASSVGLSVNDFYGKESFNWQAQSIGQDLVDLFLVVPCLLITGFLSWRNYRVAIVLWGGVVLYLIYTFIIYCFDVHFNNLFVIYCFILGLSFYSFIYFLSEQSKESFVTEFQNSLPVRVVGIYFLVIPALFYFLWLSEIIPAIIQNTTPKNLIETGLPTNPVHVIDLALFLPGLFIIGILMLKRKPMGLLFAPAILTFFVLMDITIGFLIIVMKHRGLESNLAITIVMAVLALFSMTMLIWYLRNMKQPL